MTKPEFVYVTYIETTPEKLWETLTSSEFSRRYSLLETWTALAIPFAALGIEGME
jgi:hypothetical protein